jgi:hypothetical protein
MVPLLSPEKNRAIMELYSPWFSRHAGLDPASGMSSSPKGNWIPAFAGMTRLKWFSRHAGLDPASGMSSSPKGNWIPAFAGMTKLKMQT